jgi:translocation and assembly module TamB
MRHALAALRIALRATAWLVGLVALIAASAVLQLNAPVVRRVVIVRVNQLVFDWLFAGKVEILTLGHLDAGGVSGVSARVRDPAGRQVILAEGLRARINTVKLLQSLLPSPKDIVIDLPIVTIENADVDLDMDDKGVAIANAFFPRTPSTKPPSPPDGHGVHVDMPHIRIDHASAHGQMPGVPTWDDDVTALDVALSISPARLTLDAKRGNVVARRVALGADAVGSFGGHLEVALTAPNAIGGRATWDGSVGEVRETASGSLDSGKLDVTFDARDVSPDAIRTLWPASPITGTAAAHVEAHGPLDAIELAVHAGLDHAMLDVQGQLAWGDTKRAKVHIETDSVDLRQFAPGAGASALSLKTDVSLGLDANARLEGAASLELASGHIGGILVPRTTLTTSGFRERDGAFGGDGTVVIEEPGAPTTVTLHAVPRGHSSTVAFTVATHALRLDSVHRLSATATGSAHVLGRGVVDLDSLALDVAIDTRGNALEQGELQLGTLSVKAKAKGSLYNPIVDVDVHAESLRWGKVDLTDVDVSAHGRALTPHVTVREHSRVVPDLDGFVDVDLLGGPSFSAADLTVSHAGESARVQADHVRLANGGISVDGVTIDGLGAPLTGSFAIAGHTVRVTASSPGLDVKRVARFVDADDIVRAGVLKVDADVSLHGANAEGRATLDLSGATIGMVEGISASLQATLESRRFAGKARLEVGDMGSVAVDAKKLEIGPDGALTRSSWRRAWGDVALHGHVDLAKVASHLPSGWLPIGTMSGVVDVDGQVGRDSANDFTPLVEVSVGTKGLLIAGKATSVAGKTTSAAVAGEPSPPPWILQGVDTTTKVRVNGNTGFTEVETHVHDAKGDLAVVKGTSGSVPYEALSSAPGNAVAALEATSFDATITLPSRSLTTWPAWLTQRQVEGDLGATISLKGPLTAPSVDLTATLKNADPRAARLTTSLDVTAHATYDGSHVDMTVKGTEKDHELLSGEAHLAVNVTDLLRGALSPDWKASLQMHVDEFPLVTVGALDDRQIRGRLSGDITLDDLHDNARARVGLEVAGLRIGDISYKAAKASILADGPEVRATVQIDQNDGFAMAEASVAASWGRALLPRADPAHKLDVTLRTSHFRAAALLPFVQGTCDELDGRIDADAQMTFDPATAHAGLVGSASLTEGLIEIGALGGELHDISAKLVLKPGGVLTLEDATASGVSGKVLASASARLNGLALESARAVVQIPKASPLPLSVNGSQLGIIDGKLDLSESLSADHHTVQIKVDVPTLHVVLPESGSQDVQALGPIVGVKIGTRAKAGGEFVVTSLDPIEDRDDTPKTRPEDAIKVVVATHLGDDVIVRRGGQLKVGITGDPTVTIADKTRVSGQLRLKNGNLDVYGKAFQIETGTVTFVGDDSSNPQVNVRAQWTAGDGTRVWADFVGPLRTGKVHLTSEPSYPPNEITQLLMFGTVDATQGATPGGVAGTSTAAGVAGGAATQPLNHALDQFGLSAVSAKIDTSSVNPKPEVEVQIARNISVQLAVILGVPPPGSNPDTTFLTIDWRFLKKLSLESTVGNAGSTIVDMVWRYRY